MPDIKDGGFAEVTGSKGDKYTLRNRNGVYSCTCPAWQRQRVPEKLRTCKHLKSYRGEQQEEQRLANANAKASAGDGSVVPVVVKRSGVWREDVLDKVETALAEGRLDEAARMLSMVGEEVKRFEWQMEFSISGGQNRDYERYIGLRDRLESVARQQRLKEQGSQKRQSIVAPLQSPTGQESAANAGNVDGTDSAPTLFRASRAVDPRKSSSADGGKWEFYARGVTGTFEEAYEKLVKDDDFLKEGVWTFLKNREAQAVFTRKNYFKKDENCLLEVFVRLVNEGRVDRSLMFECCLSCLATVSEWSFSAVSEWFGSLYDHLKPGAGERRAHATTVIAILETGVHESSIQWGCAALSKVNLADCGIDANDLSQQLSTIFPVSSKVTNNALLGLLKTLAKQQCSLAARVAASSLINLKQAEYQKKAIDIIVKCGSAADDELINVLKESVGSLKGELLQQAQEWLLSAEGENGKAVDENEYEYVNELERYIKQAEELPLQFRQLAAVDKAIDAARRQIVSAGSPNLLSTKVPRLDPSKRIEPLRDLNDLIFAFMQVIGKKASGEDIERVLDGVSRFAKVRPFDFRLKTSRLRERAIDRLQPREVQDVGIRNARPFRGVNHQEDLAGLALAWTDGTAIGELAHIADGLRQVVLIVPTVNEGSSPLAFFSARVLWIARRLVRGLGGPLLSMPTHKGGWIDPRVVPQRVRMLEASGSTIDHYDGIQCLLRLAPDRREEAMELSRELAGEFACALRYALGGQPSERPLQAGLWIAASRARNPLAADDWLAKQGWQGPDIAEPAQYLLDPGLLRETVDPFLLFHRGGFLGTTKSVKVTVDNSAPNSLPTALLHCKPQSIDQLMLTNKPAWEPLIWPQCRESYFSGEARQVFCHLNSKGTFWQHEWEPLFDPDVHAGGAARFLIAFAASTKHETCISYAIDALISVIEDDRLDGFSLGEALSYIIPSGAFVPSRMVPVFEAVANISPLHLEVIRTALQYALLRGDEWRAVPPPKYLQLIHTLCVKSGEGICDGVIRDFLSSLVKRGIQAKVATALLKIAHQKVPPHRREVLLCLVQKRIERALRWHKWKEASVDATIPLLAPYETAERPQHVLDDLSNC